MTIRFLIKRKNVRTEHYNVYLGLFHKETAQLIPVGMTTTRAEWSMKDCAPKNSNSELARAMVKLRAVIQKILLRMELDDKTASPVSIKLAYLDQLHAKENAQKRNDLQDLAARVTITKLANIYLEDHLFKFRASTQRTVKNSINTFLKFLKASGKTSITKEQFTASLINDYERYLITKRKVSDNTQGRLLKHLTWFMKSIQLDTSGIRIRSVRKAILWLTLDELRRLEMVDVSFDKEWQRAKDLFLLGCYTGLRISDLKRLNPVNTAGGMITLKLIKNDKNVKIPILAAADAILKRYGYKSPKLSEQVLNVAIKKVCEKANINERTIVETVIGGQRVSKTLPKYKLISSHIAGKTFITLAPERWGLTPAEIAAIVGKDLRTLLISYFGDKAGEARTKMIDRDQAYMKVVYETAG